MRRRYSEEIFGGKCAEESLGELLFIKPIAVRLFVITFAHLSRIALIFNPPQQDITIILIKTSNQNEYGS